MKYFDVETIAGIADLGKNLILDIIFFCLV